VKENEFLSVINNTLKDNSFLGDDCAFIEEGLYITQDSLVEDVHFDLKTITPRQLGYKSVAVNLSDIASCLAKPKYITISFSAPNSCTNAFIEEFYKGISEICQNYGVKVIGGDITGGEKIFISITAIGAKASPYKAARNCAKEGQVVFSTGFHGLSAAGLCLITNGDSSDKTLINAHLKPIPNIKEAEMLAKVIDSDIALMDTSDGLGDALYKISEASNVCLSVDYNKIKAAENLIQASKKYNKPLQDWIFWGGEDYNLVGTISKKAFDKLDKNIFTQIGEVLPLKDRNVIIKNQKDLPFIDKKVFESKVYNHFE